MIKQLLFATALFASSILSAATPAGSFEYKAKTAQRLTPVEVSAFFAKLDFENYRLYDKRTTLTFDNGFDIIMLSALETEQLHLIDNSGTYMEAFPPEFILPVFHMADNGNVGAAYPIADKKYSAKH